MTTNKLIRRLGGMVFVALLSANSLNAVSRTYLYDRWYNVDTLQCSKVGPGTEYSSIKFTSEDSSLTFRTFFLKVDVNNPHLKFEAELGCDSLITGETVRHHAQSRTVPGKYYIAGTNGDFYTTATPVGVPLNNFIGNSQIGLPATWAAPNFVIEKGNIPWISPVAKEFTMSVNGGSPITINSANYARYANQLVLFNSLNGKYTHTAAGGREIAIVLAPGETWKINAPVHCIVQGVMSTNGNMRIPDGQAVLSAEGTMASVIESLKDGDQIVLNMNQKLTSWSDAMPDITSIMGGNVILVANGVTLSQGDMARHPRTMLGYTKDKKEMIMCVVDGRSSLSSGGIYLEMADVMRYAGADWAMNIDGGGSSTMYIQNLGIMNIPSDGSERAVSNGVYLVMDTPEDNTISEIRFVDYALKFPKYGVYTPHFYGYNQYGMLIDNDVKGVVLSCDSKLGHVQNDSIFVGDGMGSYPLTATYNGITATIPVTISPVEKVQSRLSTIINDSFREYPMEVEAYMAETKMPISASSLSWSVDDSSIATINPNTGVLKGIKNGSTIVRGRVDDATLETTVQVEIPTGEYMPFEQNLDPKTWKITQTGGKDMVTTNSGNGMKLTYTGNGSSRGANIKLTKEVTLWSIPDAFHFKINPGNANIKNMFVCLLPNNSVSVNSTVTLSLKPNEFNDVVIPISNFFNPDDMKYYPVKLAYITMNMGVSASNTEFAIDIPNIECKYNALSSVGSITADKDMALTIYPNPITAGEIATIQVSGESMCNLKVFNTLGKQLNAYSIEPLNGVLNVPTAGLTASTYLLTILQDGVQQSAKLIVK